MWGEPILDLLRGSWLSRLSALDGRTVTRASVAHATAAERQACRLIADESYEGSIKSRQYFHRCSVLLRQRRGLDTGAAPGHLHRPAERAAQPLRLHHPQLLTVLPDSHAALVEVEQHADAVTLLLRVLHPLPVVEAGQAARSPVPVL